MKKEIVNEIINRCNKKIELIKDDIIDSIDSDLNKEGYSASLQLENLLLDLINEIECDLYRYNLLAEDENLLDLINDSDYNVRNQMFDIITTPIDEHYTTNGHTVIIDRFYEILRVLPK